MHFQVTTTGTQILLYGESGCYFVEKLSRFRHIFGDSMWALKKPQRFRSAQQITGHRVSIQLEELIKTTHICWSGPLDPLTWQFVTFFLLYVPNLPNDLNITKQLITDCVTNALPNMLHTTWERFNYPIDLCRTPSYWVLIKYVSEFLHKITQHFFHAWKVYRIFWNTLHIICADLRS